METGVGYVPSDARMVAGDRMKRLTLRRVLIRDQADRDAISSMLMRYRDQNGQDWADIIDFLMMWLMLSGRRRTS
jgi:hypothetical protein